MTSPRARRAWPGAPPAERSRSGGARVLLGLRRPGRAPAVGGGGRRLRILRVLRVLLVLLLVGVVVGAALGRVLQLALALLRPVVGVVEALALEVHGDGVEHALDGRAALLAGLHRVVAHPLHDLERVVDLAAVLVDGHRRGCYGQRGPSASIRATIGASRFERVTRKRSGWSSGTSRPATNAMKGSPVHFAPGGQERANRRWTLTPVVESARLQDPGSDVG